MPNIPNVSRLQQTAKRLGVKTHQGRRSARDQEQQETAQPAEPKARGRPRGKGKAKPKPRPVPGGHDIFVPGAGPAGGPEWPGADRPQPMTVREDGIRSINERNASPSDVEGPSGSSRADPRVVVPEVD